MRTAVRRVGAEPVDMKSTYLSTFAACALGLAGAGAMSLAFAQNTPAQDRRVEAATGEQVGISSQDGIRASGADVVVTRNGVSETLLRELRLNNGLRIMPDGKMVLPDGRTATLKAEQTLTFEGDLFDTPTPPNRPVVPTPVQPPGSSVNSEASASGSVGAAVGVSGGSGGGQIDQTQPGAAGGLFIGGGGTASGTLNPLAPQTTMSSSIDPVTGQRVFTGTDLRTGLATSTTTDSGTGQTVTTTTDSQTGARVSQTTDPRTGLPVTTVTDPATGRSTATTVDPRTGRTIPAATSPSPGVPPGSPNQTAPPQNPAATQPGTNQPGANQPATSPQGGPTSGSGTSGGAGSGTSGGTSGGGTPGAGANGTSGGTSGGAGGGTSGGGPR